MLDLPMLFIDNPYTPTDAPWIITTTEDASAAVDVVQLQSTAANGYSSLGFLNNTGTVQFHVGHGNASLADANLAGRDYLYNLAANDLIVYDAGTVIRAIFTGSGSSRKVGIGNDISPDGFFAITQPAIADAATYPALVVKGGAHTSMADSEIIDINANLARTVTFDGAASPLATQRAVLFQAPTYAAGAALTITNSATVAITGAPASGTNVTQSNPLALWVQAGKTQFDPTMTIASAAGAVCDAIDVSAATITISGSTGVTTATGFNYVNIGQPTYTSAAAVTIGSTFYIAGPPTGTGAPATALSLWVDAGNVRFDGDVTLADTTPLIQATGANGALTIQGNSDAADAGTDITLRSTATRTAGLLLDVKNNTFSKFSIGWNSKITQSVDNMSGAATGTTGAWASYSSATYTASDADPFASHVFHSWGASRLTITNAVTCTDAANVYVATPLVVAGAGTVTNIWSIWAEGGIKSGGRCLFTPTYTVASDAGAVLNALDISAATITVTGDTQVTTATGFNFVNVGIPTYTDASAITIDIGSTVYIAGPPTAAGSLTLTTGYSLWVDDGNVRFDGNLLLPSGYIKLTEIADPAAPPDTEGCLYQRSNGVASPGYRTQLVWIPPTSGGAAVVIAESAAS